MRDECEMRQVDGGDHERHQRVAPVVLCVGEDGELSFEELGFCEALVGCVHHQGDPSWNRGQG